MQVVPMCKLHVVAASRSNLRQWILVPSPPDLQQLALVVFSFQPMTSIALVQLALCGGGIIK